MEKGIMLEYKGIMKPFGGQTLGKVHGNLSLKSWRYVIYHPSIHNWHNLNL